MVWNALHGDIADLRDRMTRIEGLFEGFTKRKTALFTRNTSIYWELIPP